MTANYVFLPVLFLCLFLSVFLVNKIITINLPSVKYIEIEGLRGFLAFFVLLHHSYIWSIFLKTNEWKETSSNLFNQFGQSSVVLFFMITAFLFTNKLLNANSKTINWKNYLTSRFYRLFPAYLFSIIILLFIVLILSDFKSADSILSNVKNVTNWLIFTIEGPTDINKVEKTFLINAGVTWSLPYEWLFYLILPLIALCFKVKVNKKVLLLFSLTFIVIAFINHANPFKFIPFLAGIITSVLMNKKLQPLQNIVSSFVILFLISIQVYFFNSGNTIIPIVFTACIFHIIASGNDMFGILSNRYSRLLGQVTYSMYLLHGIVLFIVFRFIIGFDKIAQFSDTKYWIVITICVFPIVLLSQICYIYIELPFINYVKRKQ